MSEIAKCPICGENPNWFPIAGWESGWKIDMLMCCGYGSTAVKGWNKYAAAMELAKAEAKMTKAIEDGAAFDCARIDLFEAKRRVLEVFE